MITASFRPILPARLAIKAGLAALATLSAPDFRLSTARKVIAHAAPVATKVNPTARNTAQPTRRKTEQDLQDLIKRTWKNK